MPSPFLIARFVVFGRPFISAAVIIESHLNLSLSALLVHLNLLILIFAAWNISATVSAGLSGMLARIRTSFSGL